MSVQPQRLPTAFEFTGEVQPYRRVEVRSRIDGIIEARPFTEGSVVKPGQVLYRIERIRPEAAYQSARRPGAERQAHPGPAAATGEGERGGAAGRGQCRG